VPRKRQPDGQAGGAQRGQDGSGLDAELSHHGDHDEDQDGVPRAAGDQRRKRGIEPLDAVEGAAHRALDPSGGNPTHRQQQHRARDIQRLAARLQLAQETQGLAIHSVLHDGAATRPDQDRSNPLLGFDRSCESGLAYRVEQIHAVDGIAHGDSHRPRSAQVNRI